MKCLSHTVWVCKYHIAWIPEKQGRVVNPYHRYKAGDTDSARSGYTTCLLNVSA